MWGFSSLHTKEYICTLTGCVCVSVGFYFLEGRISPGTNVLIISKSQCETVLLWHDIQIKLNLFQGIFL